jgi:hypothetical protein
MKIGKKLQDKINGYEVLRLSNTGEILEGIKNEIESGNGIEESIQGVIQREYNRAVGDDSQKIIIHEIEYEDYSGRLKSIEVKYEIK